MKKSWIEQHRNEYRKDCLYRPLEGGWGWIIVAAAALSMAAFGFIMPTFTFLFTETLEEMGSGTGGAVIVVNVFAALLSLSGLVSGPLIKYVSYQASAVFGSLLGFIGYVLTYFGTETWHIVITIGILQGLSTGCVLQAGFIAINSYFEKKRNWAVGLAWSGAGISQMIMPLAITYMLKQNGYGATILAISATTLNVAVVAILYHPLCDHSKTLKINEDFQELNPLNGPPSLDVEKYYDKGKKSCCRRFRDFFDLDVLTDPVFLNLTFLSTVALTVNVNSHVLIPLYLKKHAGLRVEDIATVISVRGIGDLISRAGVSWMLDRGRVTARFSLWSSVLLISILRSCIATQYNIYVQGFLCFIEGSACGVMLVTFLICYSESFPQEKLPTVIGLSTSFRVLGKFVIGPLTGYLSGTVGDQRLAIHTLNGLMLLSAAFWVLEYVLYYFKMKKMKPIFHSK